MISSLTHSLSRKPKDFARGQTAVSTFKPFTIDEFLDDEDDERAHMAFLTQLKVLKATSAQEEH
jgi:hypothetical protein